LRTLAHAFTRTFERRLPPRHRTFVRGSYQLRCRPQPSCAPNPKQRRIGFRTLFTVARYTVNPEGQSAQGQSWPELAIEAVKLSGYTLEQFLPGPRNAPISVLPSTIATRVSGHAQLVNRQKTPVI
ncbi:hypothetical protein PQQ96_41735, partial [Paraburkholderia sediminicola]|uniref:hypothetical protein n=1 Tax=Paraburkholderia sediminicola TaxID=458836 RepID=UPI0038B8DD99